MRITVVGSGGWGTALAVLLYHNGHHVTVWSYSQQEVDYIQKNHENALLKGVKIPKEIALTTDISTVADCGKTETLSGRADHIGICDERN